MNTETTHPSTSKPIKQIFLLVGFPGPDHVGEVIAVAEQLEDLNQNSETLKTDPTFSNHSIYAIDASRIAHHVRPEEQQQPTVRG